MLKQDRTIIHVEVKDTHEHFYFGSAAAMFQDSRVKYLLKIGQYEMIGLSSKRARSYDEPQEPTDANQHEVFESPIAVNNNGK